MEPTSDKVIDLFAVRSMLFLPASNPRAIAKARESAADLGRSRPRRRGEAGGQSDRARRGGRGGRGQLADADCDPDQCGRSEWHSLDLDAAARSKACFVVVPRALSAHLVHGVAKRPANPCWL